MRICKYCQKLISDNVVWNPDQEGNGYHHACLCEMEFRLRDRQIYDKGRADILGQIRAEIEELDRHYDNDYYSTNNCPMYKCNEVLLIIDKYRNEVSK